MKTQNGKTTETLAVTYNSVQGSSISPDLCFYQQDTNINRNPVFVIPFLSFLYSPVYLDSKILSAKHTHAHLQN